MELKHLLYKLNNYYIMLCSYRTTQRYGCLITIEIGISRHNCHRRYQVMMRDGHRQSAASRKRVFAAVTEDNSDADENQSLACQMCQGDGHHMLYIDKLDDIS